MRKLNVLVACGGGIATSTFAAEEIERIAREAGVEVNVSKSPLSDVPAIAKEYDICFVTSKYSRDVGCEVISVSGLITGLDEEGATKRIAEALTRVSAAVGA